MQGCKLCSGPCHVLTIMVGAFSRSFPANWITHWHFVGSTKSRRKQLPTMWVISPQCCRGWTVLMLWVFVAQQSLRGISGVQIWGTETVCVPSRSRSRERRRRRSRSASRERRKSRSRSRDRHRRHRSRSRSHSRGHRRGSRDRSSKHKYVFLTGVLLGRGGLASQWPPWPIERAGAWQGSPEQLWWPVPAPGPKQDFPVASREGSSCTARSQLRGESRRWNRFPEL